MPPSHASLTERIASRLADEILGGTRKPYEKLPTEAELVSSTGASRVTVRRAMQVLQDRGLIVKRPGKGTFVLPRAIPYDAAHGFIDTMASQGVTPELRLLAFDVIPAPSHVAAALRQSEVLHLTRQLLVDGRPFCLDEVYVTHAAALISREMAEAMPTHRILQSILGFTIAHVELTAWAERAGSHVGPLVGARPSTPLLVFERIAYSGDDEPIEHARFYVRSESYRFRFSLAGLSSSWVPSSDSDIRSPTIAGAT